MNSTWNCRLCQDIYQKRGSVESFITHFNKDHTRKELPNPCLFQVFQCPVCKLITKSRRGLSRHINAKHRSPSYSVPNHDGASFSAESASMDESPKTDRSECASVHESWKYKPPLSWDPKPPEQGAFQVLAGFLLGVTVANVPNINCQL